MSELIPTNLATRIGGQLKTEFKKRTENQKQAVTKAAAGDFDGAVALLQDNLSWCEQNLSEDHGMTVWHLEELAIQLANLGRYKEAFDYDDKAYRIRKRTDGDSPKVLETLGHFAYVILQLGRLELAAEHYEMLWTAQKKKFGESHEETIRTAADLAGCWQRMFKANNDKGLLNKATRLHSEVLEARTKQEPQMIDRLVQSREDLGLDFLSAENFSKAKELFKKNIEELKALNKSTSIDVAGLRDRNDKFLKLIEAKESEAKRTRAEERRRRREEEDSVKKEKEVQERNKKTQNDDQKSPRSTITTDKPSNPETSLSPQTGKSRPRATSETGKPATINANKESGRRRPASEDRSKVQKADTDAPGKDSIKPSTSSGMTQKPEIKFSYKRAEDVKSQQKQHSDLNGKVGGKEGKAKENNESNQKPSLPAIVVQDTAGEITPRKSSSTKPSQTPRLPPNDSSKVASGSAPVSKEKQSKPGASHKTTLFDRPSSVPPNARRSDPEVDRTGSEKDKSDQSKLDTKSDVGATSDGEQNKISSHTKKRSKSNMDLPNKKEARRKLKQDLGKAGAIFDASEGLPGDKTVEDWFDHIQEINEVLLDSLRKSKSQRVKIAILDTGIDTTHSLFQDKRSKRRIKVCENFLDDGDTSDVCGHGSHCVQLIRKIAPEADIFVARVARDFDTDLDEFAITKAIQRACRPRGHGDAKSNWDVDIISLSIGFYNNSWPVYQALKEASQANKLIFAAASNNGLRKRMTFPAFLPDIICINASNGDGSPSSFNPPARAGKQLAILGENVESAWKCELGSNSTLRTMTGTSVATPIAAAVAALVLEIAMLPTNDAAETIFHRCLPYMRTYNGMTAILEDMSEPRDSYLNVLPWIRLYHDSNNGPGDQEEIDSTILRLAYNSEQVLRRVFGVLIAPPDEPLGQQ